MRSKKLEELKQERELLCDKIHEILHSKDFNGEEFNRLVARKKEVEYSLSLMGR